jgi:long-chain acyl-CoA synthetase
VQERYQELYEALYDEDTTEKEVEASFQYQDGQTTSVKTRIAFYTVKGV